MFNITSARNKGGRQRYLDLLALLKSDKANMPMFLTCRSRSPAAWHRLLSLVWLLSCLQQAQLLQQTRSL